MPRLINTEADLDAVDESLNTENVAVQEFLDKLEIKRNKEYHCKKCYQLFKTDENTDVFYYQ